MQHVTQIHQQQLILVLRATILSVIQLTVLQAINKEMMPPCGMPHPFVTQHWTPDGRSTAHFTPAL